mmetsp:Transcript_32758/g.45471  ORF Transcript_32758/g.45471 Transcript_32758/m.45471 type:complete len:582 (+) Transcript_32758:243-1988(+)
MSNPNVFNILSLEEADEMSSTDRHTRIEVIQKQLNLLQKSEENAKKKVRVLKSVHFSDMQIFRQVAMSKFQLPLSHHKWNALMSMGPCFVELSLCGIASLEQSDGSDGSLQLALQLALKDSSCLINAELRDHLLANMDSVYDSIRVIGESYLSRDLPKSEIQDDGGEKIKDAASIHLQGDLGAYRPHKFLAKGSAGLVYTALLILKDESVSGKWKKTARSQMERLHIKKVALGVEGTTEGTTVSRSVSGNLVNPLQNWTAQVVLKRIKPTQKDSAENEYRIARKLAQDGGARFCVAYMDRVEDESKNLWLVLRRILPSDYGIDLKEYILLGFFQMENHKEHAQRMVVRILKGLEHMAEKGIVMRDVKADNVLVELNSRYKSSDVDEEKYIARWSDFGLAVDVSNNGELLRSPQVGAEHPQLVDQLVGWWYDTQKQVPKSKWLNRIPPERSYQVSGVPISAYDIYMTGIMFCSMAFGIDFAHMDKPSIKEEVQKKLSLQLPDDYLTSFELGNALSKNRKKFNRAFTSTFGDSFGEELLKWVENMLNSDPSKRPTPDEVSKSLVNCDGEESKIMQFFKFFHMC